MAMATWKDVDGGPYELYRSEPIPELM